MIYGQILIKGKYAIAGYKDGNWTITINDDLIEDIDYIYAVLEDTDELIELKKRKKND